MRQNLSIQIEKEMLQDVDISNWLSNWLVCKANFEFILAIKGPKFHEWSEEMKKNVAQNRGNF